MTRPRPISQLFPYTTLIRSNLLFNAVKFTPKGGTIQVEFRRTGSSAEVVIRDTGVGIAPDFLPHVFERFRQAESAVTRRSEERRVGKEWRTRRAPQHERKNE